jgi:hypothetical protein
MQLATAVSLRDERRVLRRNGESAWPNKVLAPLERQLITSPARRVASTEPYRTVSGCFSSE